MTRGFTRKAKTLIAFPKDESGVPSVLVGYGLEDIDGKRSAFYPRYGDQIQIFEELCKKEDFRYPNGEGRHFLLTLIMRLGVFHTTEDIMKDAKLKRKHKLLPVIRTEKELDSWLKNRSSNVNVDDIVNEISS